MGDYKTFRLTFPLCILVLLCSSLLFLTPAVAAGETAGPLATSGWLPQDSGVTANLLAVSAVDGTTAWAAGEGGLILKTSDGGETWVQQLAGEYGDITSLSAVDSNTAWAAGNQSGFEIPILRTVDGGAHWEKVFPSASDPDVYMYLYDVDALDANTAWVAAFTLLTGDPFMAFESVLKTVDGGTTWSVPHSGYGSPAPGVLTGISIADPGTVRAAGAAGRIMVGILGGSLWAPQTSGITNDLTGVDCANPNTAWAVGEGGAIIRTANGGFTWSPQDSGTAITLQGISAADAGTAWAVGEDGTILKTVDGGAVWQPQESGVPGVALNDVDAVDVTTAWAVGSGGTILKTTSGGNHKPAITSIEPSTGLEGCEITLSGISFGGVQGDSYVSFGSIPVEEYISWSDTMILLKVPAGVNDLVKVTVTTCEGTSNGVDFSNLTVSSITPDSGMQFTTILYITDLAGTGFKSGASVKLEADGKTINATGVVVLSDQKIQCTLNLFFAQPGIYDIVVKNTDGMEARLEDGFTVTSACGQGSSAGILMLGITLGLLSLAGSIRIRKMKKDPR